MTAPAEPTREQAFVLAHRLAPADKLLRIERLVRDVLPAVQPTAVTPTRALPVITEGTWSDAIPTSRKDLYDNRGR